MIDAIVVADECVGDAAQLQESIPICIVPRQTRYFQSEYDANMSQRDFTCEASKSGALIGAGARQPQIFIDEDHILFGPDQLASPVGKGVLSGCSLAVILALVRRRCEKVIVRGV